MSRSVTINSSSIFHRQYVFLCPFIAEANYWGVAWFPVLCVQFVRNVEVCPSLRNCFDAGVRQIFSTVCSCARDDGGTRRARLLLRYNNFCAELFVKTPLTCWLCVNLFGYLLLNASRSAANDLDAKYSTGELTQGWTCLWFYYLFVCLYIYLL